MLCPRSAVLLVLWGRAGGHPRGPAPAALPIRGPVAHFCCLLPSLCRQQRRESPEGRMALGGGAPHGEGSRPPGHAPLSWVSV